MGTTATQMPPLSQAIADPKTGLATPNMGLWQQELLRARQSWIAYVPTVTNLSSLTVNDCAFQALGKLIVVRIAVKGTSNGSIVNISLPFPIKGTVQAFAAVLTTSGTQFGASASASSGAPSTVIAQKYDGSTPANLEIDDWRIQGVYEAQ